MGLLARVSTIFKSKVNATLDRLEDPRQTLEYSYQRQLEQLQNVRRGVAEVVTAKKRIELEKAKLEGLVKTYEDEAREAVRMGRDDLAQEALARKQAMAAQLAALEDQIGQLGREQARLTELQHKLTAQVNQFRARKEVIKAQYTAAQAQVKIGEATTGLGQDMADLQLALERAQERTEQLRARAAAIEELEATQATLAVSSGDDIRDELNRLKASDDIEAELRRLKAEAGLKELPAGEPHPSS